MPLDSSEHRAASPDAYSSTTSAAECNMPKKARKTATLRTSKTRFTPLETSCGPRRAHGI